MSFSHPYALWLILLLPLLAGFFVWRGYIRQNRLMKLGDSTLIQQLTNVNHLHRRWKWILWFVAIGMIIISVARPTWGMTETQIETSDVGVIIVLDVSQSMDARDILPSRLERAKLIARNLYENLTNTYMGLVLFAGDAFVRLPLSMNNRLGITFLDSISTQSITQQGTHLAHALDVALAMRDERITHKTILIILSDGEDHIGNLTPIIQQLRQTQTIVHTIGIGNIAGTEIPIINETGQIISSKTDAFGNIVITRLNEIILKQLADVTDGSYWRATESGAELQAVLTTIEQTKQTIVQTQLQSRRAERYPLFIFIALCLLLIEAFIPQVKQEDAP